MILILNCIFRRLLCEEALPASDLEYSKIELVVVAIALISLARSKIFIEYLKKNTTLQQHCGNFDVFICERQNIPK